jgi:hypothetical protein
VSQAPGATGAQGSSPGFSAALQLALLAVQGHVGSTLMLSHDAYVLQYNLSIFSMCQSYHLAVSIGDDDRSLFLFWLLSFGVSDLLSLLLVLPCGQVFKMQLKGQTCCWCTYMQQQLHPAAAAAQPAPRTCCCGWIVFNVT